jgi:two-component system, OmpR family, alkaline phosphatase synthesis response regulator PhoP
MAENTHKLLVVEDEKNVGLTLVERLRRENFDVVWATTAIQARREVEKNPFHLALLDVGLPDGSGFDVADFLRKTQPGAAIIFLTAFGNPEDRVRGLELGAEDYVVKPFHLKELILRVQNGLKRAKYINTPMESNSVKIGKATIHFSKFEAVVDGKSISLTHKETALLKLLVEKKGEVVSRDDILSQVWGSSAEGDEDIPTSRTVDNFIVRLRRIVETDDTPVIKSIRGVGYQLL